MFKTLSNQQHNSKILLAQHTCLFPCSDLSLDSSHDTDRSVFLGCGGNGGLSSVDSPLAIRGRSAVAAKFVEAVRRSDGLGMASEGGLAAPSTACVMCSADCCKGNEKMCSIHRTLRYCSRLRAI